jgi:hypothetical protein
VIVAVPRTHLRHGDGRVLDLNQEGADIAARKEPAMRRRLALAVALVAALALAASWWAMAARVTPPGGVAVIGDRAPAILQAMDAQQALPVSSAALVVVAVNGWDKLAFISDMQALCGADCAGEAAMVRAVRLRPGGSRKVVFVNLAALPRADEEPDFACLAAALAPERRRLTGPAAGPACAPGFAAQGTRWLLPFGLGAI